MGLGLSLTILTQNSVPGKNKRFTNYPLIDHIKMNVKMNVGVTTAENLHGEFLYIIHIYPYINICILKQCRFYPTSMFC